MATTRIDETGVAPSDRSRRLRAGSLVVVLLLVGWLARSITVDGRESFAVRWLPWLQGESINLYFGHASETGFVPISRTFGISDETPGALMDALLDGPPDELGLVQLIPEGTSLRSASFADGRFSVDLSGDASAFDDPAVAGSVWLSITSWSDVRQVALSIDGTPIDIEDAAGRQMYFWDKAGDMLVAQPAKASDPRDVLDEYMAGSPIDGFVGLPSDVQVVSYRLDPRNGLLSLDFTFEDSLRQFALDDPNGVRRVLEGLIATMTITFPEVQGVYLDFGGQEVLGLGHCADLLRSLQLTPKPLNDERLVARAVA